MVIASTVINFNLVFKHLLTSVNSSSRDNTITIILGLANWACLACSESILLASSVEIS